MIGPVNNILELKASLDKIEKQAPGKVKRIGLDEKGNLVTSEKTITENKPSYLKPWAWVQRYKATSFTPCETRLLVQLKKWAPQLENELSREGVTAGFPEIKRLIDRACTPIQTPSPIGLTKGPAKAPQPQTTATVSQGTTDPISRIINELPEVDTAAFKLGRCIKTMIEQPGRTEQQVNEAMRLLRQNIHIAFSKLKTKQAVENAYMLCQHHIPELPHGSANCVKQGHFILQDMLADIHKSRLKSLKISQLQYMAAFGARALPTTAAVSPSAGKTGTGTGTATAPDTRTPATEPQPDYSKTGARPKQKLPPEVHQTAIPDKQETFTFPEFPLQEWETGKDVRLDKFQPEKLCVALNDIFTFLDLHAPYPSHMEESVFFNLPEAVEKAMTDIYQPDLIKACFDNFFQILQCRNMKGPYVEFFEDNLVQLKEAKLQALNNKWKKLFKQTLEIFIKKATTGRPTSLEDKKFASHVAVLDFRVCMT
ncbi:MAG: hypothetical protein ACPG5T_05635 [Endozoicomonas sp.]